MTRFSLSQTTGHSFIKWRCLRQISCPTPGLSGRSLRPSGRHSSWASGVILATMMLMPSLQAWDSSEGVGWYEAGETGVIHQDQYADGRRMPARFEIEAEAFSSRNNGSDRANWVTVAGKTSEMLDCGQAGKLAATTPGAARQGRYIVSVGKNAAGTPTDDGYDGPTVDYKVHVRTPGTYRLYLRWAGKDDRTDSVYAMLIPEQGDAAKGPKFFLFHGRSLKYYTGWVWDCFGLTGRTDCASAGRPAVAEWNITEPGIHTIRLACREHGTAVDSMVFQTNDLRPPGDSRGRMRVRPGGCGLEKPSPAPAHGEPPSVRLTPSGSPAGGR
jgi:hypothetical protein